MEIKCHLDEIKPDARTHYTGDIAATVIALEQAIEVRGRYAYSVVDNSHYNGITDDARLDFNRATSRRILYCVGQ